MALARAESPSTDTSALEPCLELMRRLLAEVGARVTVLPRTQAGDHLLAEAGCGERQVLMLGHFDTVWPVGQIERMPVVVRDGKLYGPGVYDMKAGLAIGLLAVQAAFAGEAAPRHRVVLLVTSDEEVGSHTSRAVIEEEARKSDAVLVLEPSLADGRVKTHRKGVGVYTLTVTGVPAHAGVAPGAGASAIHELARQVIALSGLQDVERGVSVNVGVIEGGTRSNVVAERASAEIDVRIPTRSDGERVDAAIRVTAAATARDHAGRAGWDQPPSPRAYARGARLYEHARRAAAELGFELGEGGTGGASDGNFTAALGVPTLDGLGAVGDGAHALHEHVVIDELPRRAALLAGVIERLSRG